MAPLRMLVLLAAAKGSLAGIGFCILDTQPEVLQGTGYAVTSALTEGQCTAAGHDWCPLDDEEKTFVNLGTQATEQIDYYWWSACCTGMQVHVHPRPFVIAHALYLYTSTRHATGKAPHRRSSGGSADVRARHSSDGVLPRAVAHKAASRPARRRKRLQLTGGIMRSRGVSLCILPRLPDARLPCPMTSISSIIAVLPSSPSNTRHHRRRLPRSPKQRWTRASTAGTQRENCPARVLPTTRDARSRARPVKHCVCRVFLLPS